MISCDKGTWGNTALFCVSVDDDNLTEVTVSNERPVYTGFYELPWHTGLFYLRVLNANVLCNEQDSRCGERMSISSLPLSVPSKGKHEPRRKNHRFSPASLSHKTRPLLSLQPNFPQEERSFQRCRERKDHRYRGR